MLCQVLCLCMVCQLYILQHVNILKKLNLLSEDFFFIFSNDAFDEYR